MFCTKCGKQITNKSARFCTNCGAEGVAGMDNVIVRLLNECENLSLPDMKMVAGLIYDTDPFIYPAMFGEKREEAISNILATIDKKAGFFRSENICIAKHREIITGIAVFSDRFIKINDPGLLFTEHSRKVIDEYFNSPYSDPMPNDIMDLHCLSVSSEYQGMGIGTSLIQFVIDLAIRKGNDYLRLGVRKDDSLPNGRPVYSWYYWMGFSDSTAGRGFSANGEKPEIYIMKMKL